MLGVLVDEKRIVSNVIKDKVLNVKPMVAANLLLKYYYIEGITDKLKLKERIISDLQKCDNAFLRVRWEESITKAIDKFLRNRRLHKLEVELVDIKEISITKEEINLISELGDKKIKKVAFVLLVYAKISNIVLKRDDGWINQGVTNIFKEAKVDLKGNNKQLLLRELFMSDYLDMSCKGSKTSLKINYIREDSEVVFKITDFEGVVYNYLNYLGEKWKKCCVCGKWIKQSNNKVKYCKQCGKRMNIENTTNNKKSLK